MKKSSSWMSRQRIAQTFATALLLLLFTACKKDSNDNQQQQDQDAIERSTNSGFAAQTITELKAAKTATEKYRSMQNAIADGYADINVVRQNMGFHYMKAALVDTTFNPEKPELLVYNKQHDGSIQLVAVEYAVPLALMPTKAPEGFTGTSDVWTYSTEFNLWLLHAWVWEYNPQGIFAPNNPNVHLHD